MTVERRIVVSLGDIRAVIFQCKACATRVAVLPEKLDDATALLDKCSVCDAAWWSQNATKLLAKPAASFVVFLRALRQIGTPEASETVGFTLSLEFDEPQPY